MEPIVVTRSVDLRAKPKSLWPLLTQTDRVNRWIGMGTVTPSAIDPENRSAARFVVRANLGGLDTTYEELPFEWEEERRFRVVRRLLAGPVAELQMHLELEPVGEGTRVTFRLVVVPRLGLLRPFLWWQTRRSMARFVTLAEAVDAHLAGAAPTPFLVPAAPCDREALAQATRALEEAGVEASLAQKLGEHVGTCADADAARLRPFEVADAWGEDRLRVLRAFLHAVPAGLVELRWGVVCPSCRTASMEIEALGALPSEGHCQLCDIRFELELDRAVEATFHPHRAVRVVPSQMYCIGGPARTPHVLTQTIVPDAGAGEIVAPRQPGRYRFFARGGGVASVFVEEGATGEAPIRVEGADVAPAEVHVAPGGALRVENASGVDRHVKVERLDYASTAATAHLLSTLPEFRRHFSSELVKPGTPLKVSRVAILFSDLTGSTALYTRLGDAAAFRLVDDHFDVVREAVAAHEGAVVKTMGDAVMAAFVDPRRCARAAIEALARFERFRRQHPHGEHVGLKLGMYTGPCYVVSANGALDYFGQTVNIASRVQHLAESGQLVVGEATYAALSPDDAERLRVLERFEARVKGVDDPLALVRLGF